MLPLCLLSDYLTLSSHSTPRATINENVITIAKVNMNHPPIFFFLLSPFLQVHEIFKSVVNYSQYFI